MMKFGHLWIYMYMQKIDKKLGSLGEILTDISQMNHIKSTEKIQLHHAENT